MTDNEKIKALEEIVEIMLVMGDLQKASTISKAIDQINRQKAEIERLQNDAAIARKEAERFKSSHFVVGVRGGATHRLMEIIRLMEHDAIKEFAERLKNKLTSCSKTIDGKCEYLICDFEIDTLVKEMVGDE